MGRISPAFKSPMTFRASIGSVLLSYESRRGTVRARPHGFAHGGCIRAAGTRAAPGSSGLLLAMIVICSLIAEHSLGRALPPGFADEKFCPQDYCTRAGGWLHARMGAMNVRAGLRQHKRETTRCKTNDECFNKDLNTTVSVKKWGSRKPVWMKDELLASCHHQVILLTHWMDPTTVQHCPLHCNPSCMPVMYARTVPQDCPSALFPSTVSQHCSPALFPSTIP